MIVIDAGPSALRGVERLIDHRVDALIFGLSDEAISQEQLRAVTGPDFPLVLVDQPHPGLDYDCAVNDDEGGGYQAGRHLVELGHRRFGIFHYGEGTTNCEARIKGFRRAVEEAGGRIRPEDVVDNPPHLSPEARRQCRLEGLERILRGSDRPTAFFATTDLFARSVMQVACRLGLRIPADLSVAGFADLNFSELLDPPLTTVRQNGEALGEQAGELVLARLQDPSRESRRVTISTQLIVRGSTGPLISGESGHIA